MDVELAAVASGVTGITQCVSSAIDNAQFIFYGSMELQPGVEQVRSAVKLRVFSQMVYRYSSNYNPWWYINGVRESDGVEFTLTTKTWFTSPTWADVTLDLTNYSVIYLRMWAMVPGGYDNNVGCPDSAPMLLTGDYSVIVPEARLTRDVGCEAGALATANVRGLNYDGQVLKLPPITQTEVLDDVTRYMVLAPRQGGDELFDGQVMTRPRAHKMLDADAQVTRNTNRRLVATYDGSPDFDG